MKLKNIAKGAPCSKAVQFYKKMYLNLSKHTDKPGYSKKIQSFSLLMIEEVNSKRLRKRCCQNTRSHLFLFTKSGRSRS